jgi:hypothetical protein
MSREQALARQSRVEQIIRARLKRNIDRRANLSETERVALLESEVRKALAPFDEVIPDGPPRGIPGIDDDGFFKDRS